MFSRLVHFIVIIPLSILPISFLYILSDLLCFLLFRIVGYRKSIVKKNLKNSFPNSSSSERVHIMKEFYKHFCDLMIEGIKSFTISQKQLSKRFIIKNHNIIDEYAKKGKSVIIVGGHYNNWEMLAQASSIYHIHDCLGIYKPLSNSFFNEKMKKSREKFGLSLYSMNETLRCFKKKTTKAIFFASDQSPSNYKNVFWTNFLNQDTAVQSGVERLSRLYNYPIFIYHIEKLKRGFYQTNYELLIENPNKYRKGEITQIFTKKIQNMILQNPQFWLWTHRRWKKIKTSDSI